MTMCIACSALLQGGHEHAALMSLGRRGYMQSAKARSSGGEYFVCRLCGAEWRRENGMHQVLKKKSGWGLSRSR